MTEGGSPSGLQAGHSAEPGTRSGPGALFDGYVMVDWSASATPKTGPDSIWIAEIKRGGRVSLSNSSTRAEAIGLISGLLDEARKAGLRLLIGFDFAFGYPKGAARALTGNADWEALWARIAALVEDGPDNTNNRFDAAAKLNAGIPGEGPFWGNGLNRDIAGLPRKKPAGFGDSLPPARRHIEALAKGAQEVWKLSGVGSVGGQSLTGIAALERLRHAHGAKIWPFETMGEGSTPVFCEIYPSLRAPHADEAIKDAGQVRAMAEWADEMDQAGQLKAYLEAPRNLPPEVRQEEGAILGVRPRTKLRYERDPAAIYRKSFEIVKAEARMDRFDPDLRPVITRLIHACGMTEIADRVAYSKGVAKAATEALVQGAPVLCDCEMVRSGIISRLLPAKNKVVVTLNAPEVPKLAQSLETTRSAAAVELWEAEIEGAVVVIGNAPTALFHLLERLDDDWPKPAAILGFPVGFVGAAESKAALAADPRGVEFIALKGRKGGSAMASAALNAFAAGLEGHG